MTTKPLDAAHVETLRKSAWDVLETMVSMTPTAAETIESTSAIVSSDVVGLLSFTGSKSGSFVMHTSERIARSMAAKMLMMEPGELTDFSEVADAFGEIVNMVSGGFKNAWVEGGQQMDLSVPHVIEHGNIKLYSDTVDGLRSGVRLTVDGEPVDIGIYFEG